MVCFAENCPLPKALWRRGGPTQFTKHLENFFGIKHPLHNKLEGGLGTPELYLSIKDIPADAPFSEALAELTSSANWTRLGFQAKFHYENGHKVADKNHTADFQLNRVSFCKACLSGLVPNCRAHLTS